jgi:hypothetical protein
MARSRIYPRIYSFWIKWRQRLLLAKRALKGQPVLAVPSGGVVDGVTVYGGVWLDLGSRFENNTIRVE